ncbi:uncharacterized protein LOC110444515 [Mizuhopecten yessoensis]|uniref:uncharacterized protein LOC110444515 n=1 Tax=Mizuhopecten yessoensis TaxID=6573 RepID=UPI000B459365|nr:uncharacterized protein LOC110444515 [Mizuhopecten yessoensis]
MTSELAIRSAQVHVPDPCAWCENIQDVNWYCNDCQEALCDGCKESHQRARKTRNDVVVPITRAIKQNQAFLSEVCKTHHGKSCDLYCCDCEIMMCATCFTEKHSQHVFKNIELEIDVQKQFLRELLITLDSNLDHFNDNISKRHEVSKSFEENVEVIRQSVQTQRFKLKEEIHFHSGLGFGRIIVLDVEQATETKSSASLFEMTRRMKTTKPLYDVNKKSVVPRQHHFVPGERNKDQLKTVFGRLQVLKNEDVQYEKKEVDCQQVQMISTFQMPQRTQINSICPTDDNQVWMSVYESNELVKVNKEGNVTESVKLDFNPWRLTVSNEKVLLVTEYKNSSLIHNISEDRRVTDFADISPLNASGISISDTDEVFVTTLTPTMLVLNMSGDRIRQISCGGDGLSIVNLTTGYIAVTTGSDYLNCNEMIVINKYDQIMHKWSGELDNGQKITETLQSDIACDEYDRIFVPDYNTNQVYVISGNERKAKCLLDKKHAVTDPLAVCVDMCGHVWIGCSGGTVHVMQI